MRQLLLVALFTLAAPVRAAEEAKPATQLPDLALDWSAVLSYALDAHVEASTGPALGDYVVNAETSSPSSWQTVVLRSAVLGHFTTTESPELLLLVCLLRNDRLPEVDAQAIVIRPRVLHGQISWTGSRTVLSDVPWYAGVVTAVKESPEAEPPRISPVTLNACVQQPTEAMEGRTVRLDFSHAPTSVDVEKEPAACATSKVPIVLRASRSGATFTPILIGAKDEMKLRKIDRELETRVRSLPHFIMTKWHVDENVRTITMEPEGGAGAEALLRSMGLQFVVASPKTVGYGTNAFVDTPDGDIDSSPPTCFASIVKP